MGDKIIYKGYWPRGESNELLFHFDVWKHRGATGFQGWQQAGRGYDWETLQQFTCILASNPVIWESWDEFQGRLDGTDPYEKKRWDWLGKGRST